MRWLQSVENRTVKTFANYRFTWQIADECYRLLETTFYMTTIKQPSSCSSPIHLPNDAVILFL